MILIVGLGNPGKEYENTRHNLGFIFADKLQKELGFSEFSANKKFDAEIAEGNYAGNKIILTKPQTFMNLSGEAVRKIMDFYKLTPEDILVLHDEIDLPAGKYRLATDSSSAGHNGVQNIIDQIGTQAFKRVRIGIGQDTATGDPSCRLGAHDFVLGKISSEELEKISAIEKEILSEIQKLLA
jgi:PTH1 family peptidyl-tRNA hydrolase